MRTARGVTLIELMISMTILVIVVAMAMSIVIASASVSRRGHEISDANEGARLAGETLSNALQNSGLGMSKGLWVSYGGVVVNTSPIIVINSTTGPDQLWVARAHRNGLGDSCFDEGAATTVQRSGFGTLFVRCAGGLTSANLSGMGAPTLLMATNMSSAALLSNPVFTPSGLGQNLTYTESGAGFADDPIGGFKKGDFVMPVRLERYFIANNADGIPCLMMQPGVVGTLVNGFAPTGAAKIIQPGVEDMQFSVGIDAAESGDPANITFSSMAVGPAYVRGLRSIRMSVMSRSLRRVLDSGTGGLTADPDLAPRTLEDNVIAAPVIDGLRRTLYSRRVELVNLAAEAL